MRAVVASDTTRTEHEGVLVNTDVDVVVIGGGPVGTTALALLGRLGLTAIGLEKDDGDVADRSRGPLRRRDHAHAAGAGHRREVRGGDDPDEGRRRHQRGRRGPRPRPDRPLRRPGLERPHQLPPARRRAAHPRGRRRHARASSCVAASRVDERPRTSTTASRSPRWTTDGAEQTVRARWAIAADGGPVEIRQALGHRDRQVRRGRAVARRRRTARRRARLRGRHDPVRPSTPGPRSGCGCPAPGSAWSSCSCPATTRTRSSRPPPSSGISRGVLPADKFTPDRQAIYTFRGRIAQQWRSGNVFLAGDAAHQAPPLFGQGLCAGHARRREPRLEARPRQAWTRRRRAARHLRERAQAARHLLGGDRREPGSRHPDPRPRGRRGPRRVHPGQPRTRRAVPTSPALGPGLHEGDTDERAGKLGMQPILADGTRLDDMVGTHFLVVADRAVYDELPAAIKAVLDEDGDIVTLLDPLKVGQLLASVGAKAVVIRPDHYILGVGDTAADLERLVQRDPVHRAHLSATVTSAERVKEHAMAFSPITHIRHFDIAVPDFEKQIEFYKNHWGLTVQHDDGDVVYFAAEGSPEQYVTRVRRSADKRLDLVAFGAADRQSVDTLAQDLATAGVQLVFEPDRPARPWAVATASASSTSRAARSRSRPTSRCASTARSRSARRSRSASRTSCSTRTQPETMRAWYEKHLGFRLSDTLNHPHVGDLFYFMRCSSQHHSMAIARGPHASLQHASFELRGLDEYMCGSGRIIRAGYRKIWGPGRHRAGDNTFTYFIDPNGNTMEMTTELEIDRRGHLAPAHLRRAGAGDLRPVGHRRRHGRVHHQGDVQRPRQRQPLRRAAGLIRAWRGDVDDASRSAPSCSTVPWFRAWFAATSSTTCASVLPAVSVTSDLFADWEANLDRLAAYLAAPTVAPQSLEALGAAGRLRVLPPVQPVGPILAAGANYREHIIEMSVAHKLGQGRRLGRAAPRRRGRRDRRARSRTGDPYVWTGHPVRRERRLRRRAAARRRRGRRLGSWSSASSSADARTGSPSRTPSTTSPATRSSTTSRPARSCRATTWRRSAPTGSVRRTSRPSSRPVPSLVPARFVPDPCRPAHPAPAQRPADAGRVDGGPGVRRPEPDLLRLIGRDPAAGRPAHHRLAGRQRLALEAVPARRRRHGVDDHGTRACSATLFAARAGSCRRGRHRARTRCRRDDPPALTSSHRSPCSSRRSSACSPPPASTSSRGRRARAPSSSPGSGRAHVDVAVTAMDNVFVWNHLGADVRIVAQVEQTTVLERVRQPGPPHPRRPRRRPPSPSTRSPTASRSSPATLLERAGVEREVRRGRRRQGTPGRAPRRHAPTRRCSARRSTRSRTRRGWFDSRRPTRRSPRCQVRASSCERGVRRTRRPSSARTSRCSARRSWRPSR